MAIAVPVAPRMSRSAARRSASIARRFSSSSAGPGASARRAWPLRRAPWSRCCASNAPGRPPPSPRPGWNRARTWAPSCPFPPVASASTWPCLLIGSQGLIPSPLIQRARSSGRRRCGFRERLDFGSLCIEAFWVVKSSSGVRIVSAPSDRAKREDRGPSPSAPGRALDFAALYDDWFDEVYGWLRALGAPAPTGKIWRRRSSSWCGAGCARSTAATSPAGCIRSRAARCCVTSGCVGCNACSAGRRSNGRRGRGARGPVGGAHPVAAGRARGQGTPGPVRGADRGSVGKAARGAGAVRARGLHRRGDRGDPRRPHQHGVDAPSPRAAGFPGRAGALSSAEGEESR